MYIMLLPKIWYTSCPQQQHDNHDKILLFGSAMKTKTMLEKRILLIMTNMWGCSPMIVFDPRWDI